jgi:hypothetical protein
VSFSLFFSYGRIAGLNIARVAYPKLHSWTPGLEIRPVKHNTTISTRRLYRHSIWCKNTYSSIGYFRYHKSHSQRAPQYFVPFSFHFGFLCPVLKRTSSHWRRYWVERVLVKITGQLLGQVRGWKCWVKIFGSKLRCKNHGWHFSTQRFWPSIQLQSLTPKNRAKIPMILTVFCQCEVKDKKMLKKLLCGPHRQNY